MSKTLLSWSSKLHPTDGSSSEQNITKLSLSLVTSMPSIVRVLLSSSVKIPSCTAYFFLRSHGSPAGCIPASGSCGYMPILLCTHFASEYWARLSALVLTNLPTSGLSYFERTLVFSGPYAATLMIYFLISVLSHSPTSWRSCNCG